MTMQTKTELRHEAHTALGFFLVLVALVIGSFVGYLFTAYEPIGIVCYIALWASIISLVLFVTASDQANGDDEDKYGEGLVDMEL